MSLSKPIRILVGIATLWYSLTLLITLLGILIFLGYIIVALMMGGEAALNLRTLLRQILSFELMLPIHLCSLFLEIGLLVFYLIHTIKNSKASDLMRIALGLGHLFLPFLAMPVYYYLYIWRERPPEWAATRKELAEQLVENFV